LSIRDFSTWAKQCNDNIKGSRKIEIILSDSDFINSFRKMAVENLGDTPDFYILMTHFTYWLHDDKKFEEIVIRDCSYTFVHSENYIWFCFWCSIIIFDNIRKQIVVKGEC
jgi:hypothetical protein